MRFAYLFAFLLCTLPAMAEDPAAPPAAPATPAPAPAAAPAAPLDPNLPIAKIGDGVITGAEFGRFARFRLRRLSMEAGKRIEPDARFRSQSMAELIASRVLEILAKEASVSVTDEEVAKDFEESKKNFKSPEEYDRYLKEQVLTEDALRDEVRRKLLIDKFIALKTGGIVVTPEEVQAQYDKLKADGRMNRDMKTADIAQIVALYKPDDEASMKAAKEKIDAVRERIVKGEAFEEVGKALTKDPDSGMQMGLIDEAKPSALYPEIAKVIETMKPGELSETLKTPRGYGLVLVKAWYEPGTIPLEKVSDRLKQGLLSVRERDTVAELVKTARERIPIEIYKSSPGELAPATSAPAAPATPAASAPPVVAPADLSAIQ